MNRPCFLQRSAGFALAFLLIVNSATVAQNLGIERTEATAKSVESLRVEAVATQDQLNKAMKALTTLASLKEGDLRGTYELYAREVTATEARSAIMRDQIIRLLATGTNYFSGWRNDLAQIQNNGLRRESANRLKRSQQNFDQSIASFRQAEEGYVPFLSDLKDIQKVLENDLTPGGLKAIRDTVSDANWRKRKLDQQYKSALESLDALAKQLQPAASTK